MATCCSADGQLFLGQSRGLCRPCKERLDQGDQISSGAMVDVRYVSDGKAVFLERFCPEHGISRTLVAESLPWYLEALQIPPAARPPKEAITERSGYCPGSCGPCGFHAQRCNLPVFSITNACDLRCPICFTYNRQDQTYHISEEDFARQIDFLIEATGGVDLVNITGGEPTLHPELPALLARARRPEIGRITLNSNGLTLLRKPELAAQLAELGVYVILSLDTLDPETSVRLHGRDIVADKLRCIDLLEEHGIQTTLLMVLVGGVNEGELGRLVDLTLQRDHVRSLTIQTMTYTGQGGASFAPRCHVPVDGVERRIEESTSGKIRKQHFIPLPTAHPLCYGVAYLLQDESGGVHSFADLLGREPLSRHLADGYLLQPGPALEQELKAAINRLWSEEEHPELLDAIKGMLRRLYPSSGSPMTVHERQRLAEGMVKTIYVHAHMDEDTYEVGRAMRCPDQVPVDAARLIGACNYNLFYRQQDPRFYEAPSAKGDSS
jgi:tetraether lipid synthase